MHHESHDSMSHEKHNDTQMPDIDSNSHSHHYENHNDETKNYENQYMHHNMSEITKHEIHTMKHENWYKLQTTNNKWYFSNFCFHKETNDYRHYIIHFNQR